VTDRRTLAFSLLLLVDFIVSVVMLATDKNLQTDFGVQSPYYLHWYGVLAMAVLDLLLGLALLAFSTMPALQRMRLSARKAVVMGSFVWVVLAIVAMVGIVSSYSQVGFPNANQFAQYLFGVTPYPGALSYIPWLYDLLLAAYLVTALVGAVAWMHVRSVAASAPSK
jgi:hypothetical protein